MNTSSFEPVTFEDWRARVEKELGEADFDRRLVTPTLEGIAIAPLYTGAPVVEAGTPGKPPFVRGGRATTAPVGCPRYRVPDLSQAGRWLESDQRGGAEGAWLVLDELPARSAGNLRRLLEGRSPSPLVVDAGADALPALAVLEATNAPISRLWLGADPLGVLAVNGALPGALDAFEAELAEVLRRVDARGGDHRAALISMVPHHEAGAHAVLELGYALATLAAYLRGADRRGVAPEVLARRLVLRFAIGGDTFMEVAKLRAARGLVHHMLAASGAAAEVPPIHAVASPRALSRRDPHVNMLRVTTAVFAAIVGNADVITALPFDEAIGIPSELGRRLARNTLQVLRDESHLAWVDDPAGGSWYVEALSDELARQAWNVLQRIEAGGGMAKHITSGRLREELEQAWRTRRIALARRKLRLVGVNDFAWLDEERLVRPPWTMATLDESPVGRRLESFADLVEAARHGSSISALGRATDRGAPVPAPAMRAHRDSEEYELLRTAAEALTPPAMVLLACLGPEAEHRSRAAFATDFFAAAGIAVSHGVAEGSPDEAGAKLAADAIVKGARAACLCGSDLRYESHVLAAVTKLREAGVGRVLHAGRPGDREQALRAAGVDDFIFIGADLPAVAAPLLRHLGARLPKLAEEELR